MSTTPQPPEHPMTDPTPYTDDDVKQMQDDGAIVNALTRVPISAQLARRLLDAGYRKVTPDTPPEPQERYYVVAGAVDAFQWVLDRTGEFGRVRTDSHYEAKRIAILLNDFSNGPPLEAERDEARAEVEHWKANHDNQVTRKRAAQEAAEAQAKRARDAEAEVERLTAELAKWRERYEQVQAQSRTREQTITTLGAKLNDAQLRSIEARNPGIDMDEVRRIRSAADPPQCQRHSSRSNRPVTAEMFTKAHNASFGGARIGPSDPRAAAAAAALNDQLGAHPLPTRDEVLDATRGIVRRHWDGWRPSEIVDGEGVWQRYGDNEEPDEEPMTDAEVSALNALLAQPTGEGE